MTLSQNTGVVAVDAADDHGAHFLVDFVLRGLRVEHPVELEAAAEVVALVEHVDFLCVGVHVDPVHEVFGVHLPLRFTRDQFAHAHADPDVAAHVLQFVVEVLPLPLFVLEAFLEHEEFLFAEVYHICRIYHLHDMGDDVIVVVTFLN